MFSRCFQYQLSCLCFQQFYRFVLGFTFLYQGYTLRGVILSFHFALCACKKVFSFQEVNVGSGWQSDTHIMTLMSECCTVAVSQQRDFVLLERLFRTQGGLRNGSVVFPLSLRLRTKSIYGSLNQENSPLGSAACIQLLLTFHRANFNEHFLFMLKRYVNIIELNT